MNKSILTLIVFVFSVFTVGSAQQLLLSDEEVVYKKENRSSIMVLMEPAPKTVKKAFEDWMNEQYDVNLKGIGFLANKDVLSAEQVKIPKISDKEMDFYAKVVEDNGNTRMNIFASYGYEIHFSPEKYPKEYKSLKSIAQAFLNDWLPGYYQSQVFEVSDQLNGLRDDRTKLAETIADNEKEIEKLAKENEKLSKKINKSKSELEALAQTLNTRKSKLESINKMLENIK